jgi:hypothetical protein
MNQGTYQQYKGSRDEIGRGIKGDMKRKIIIKYELGRQSNR